MKARLYEILEGTGPDDPARAWVDRMLALLVVLNVAAAAIETVESIYLAHAPWFDAFERVSIGIFTVEYVLRLWVADLHPPFRKMRPSAARLRYAAEPLALVDLLAILPFYLALAGIGADMRVLRVFRLVRFLKLARYSPGISSLMNAVADESRALTGALVVMMGLALLSATALYLFEHRVQPDTFGSIPAALWWAIATLTTVGYGDAVPITVAGRLVGAVVMVLGLAMFAVPVGIIATAFAREMHSREFVVTWSMVARVPLFADLSASEIATVMKLLHSRKFPAGTRIVEEGEAAQSMYFIASGEVRMEVEGKSYTLEEGAFFGEIAVLHRARRSATVTALTAVSLLELEAAALHKLMQQNPDIARQIREAVRERVSRGRISPSGDMVSDELRGPGSEPS